MKSMAAAIEFGTSKIVTLIGEGGGEGAATLLGYGIVPYDGYCDGHWNAADEDLEQAIAKSIREAELSSGREIKEIYIGVPGDFIHVEHNEISADLGASRRITMDDVDDVMNQALEYTPQRTGVIIHRSPSWFTVDDKRTMEPAGLKGQVIACDAAFILADPVFLEDVQARMEQMNIHVNGYLSPALGEALMLIPPEERDKGAILVDIGYLSTEIMTVEGDAVIAHEVLPVGGGDLTAELAVNLQITMDMAEDLKRKYSFGVGSGQLSVSDPDGQEVLFPRETVLAIVEPKVEEIGQAIARAMNARQDKLTSRSSYYLTGGGIAPMRGGRETLSSVAERTFRAPVPTTAKLNSPIYSSSLGLLELVYESVSSMDGARNESGSKIGKFFKAFFTK